MTDLIDTEVAQVQHEQYAQASAAVGSQVGGRRPMSSAQAYQEAVKQAWARALVHVEPSIQLQRDLCQPEFGKEASHPPSSVARQAEAIASQGVSKRVEKRRSAGLDSIGASSVLSSGSSYSCSSASSSSTQSSTLSLSAKGSKSVLTWASCKLSAAIVSGTSSIIDHVGPPVITLTEMDDFTFQARSTRELSLMGLEDLNSLPRPPEVPCWLQPNVVIDGPTPALEAEQLEGSAGDLSTPSSESLTQPRFFSWEVARTPSRSPLNKRFLCPPPSDARGRANCAGRWWSRRNMGYDFVRPTPRRTVSSPANLNALLPPGDLKLALPEPADSIEVLTMAAAARRINRGSGSPSTRPKIVRFPTEDLASLRSSDLTIDPFPVKVDGQDFDLIGMERDSTGPRSDSDGELEVFINRRMQDTSLTRKPRTRSGSAPPRLRAAGAQHAQQPWSQTIASPLDHLRRTLEQQHLAQKRMRATSSPPPMPSGGLAMRRGAFSGESYLPAEDTDDDDIGSETEHGHACATSSDEEDDGLSTSSSTSESEGEDDDSFTLAPMIVTPGFLESKHLAALQVPVSPTPVKVIYSEDHPQGHSATLLHPNPKRLPPRSSSRLNA